MFVVRLTSSDIRHVMILLIDQKQNKSVFHPLGPVWRSVWCCLDGTCVRLQNRCPCFIQLVMNCRNCVFYSCAASWISIPTTPFIVEFNPQQRINRKPLLEMCSDTGSKKSTKVAFIRECMAGLLILQVCCFIVFLLSWVHRQADLHCSVS